uniref:Oligomycin sensitivity conferral protein n=1 Tax=Octopus bimaculoides TaxID=37653 RepID=A0A0L8HRY0_OCTBM
MNLPVNITQVRQFATSSLRHKLVKAPVQVFGIEGRYATALYSAATKENKLDLVQKDLTALKYDILLLISGALSENGRIQKLSGVINAFETIMSSHRGEVPCTVTTAKVDPTIIGGMLVNIGDKFVDMSMSTKIRTYTNLIKQAV